MKNLGWVSFGVALIFSASSFAGNSVGVRNGGGLGEFLAQEILQGFAADVQHCLRANCGWTPAQKQSASAITTTLSTGRLFFVWTSPVEFEFRKNTARIQSNLFLTKAGSGDPQIWARADRFFSGGGQFISSDEIRKQLGSVLLQKAGIDSSSATDMMSGLITEMDLDETVMSFQAQGIPDAGFVLQKNGRVIFFDSEGPLDLSSKFQFALECNAATDGNVQLKKVSWDALIGWDDEIRATIAVDVQENCGAKLPDKTIEISGLIKLSGGRAPDFFAGRKGLALKAQDESFEISAVE